MSVFNTAIRRPCIQRGSQIHRTHKSGVNDSFSFIPGVAVLSFSVCAPPASTIKAEKLILIPMLIIDESSL